MPKFVESSPSQGYLQPPDMRKWVPEDDLAHFVLEALERVPMSAFRVNGRGTGSAHYHPRTMLALLIYSYANGTGKPSSFYNIINFLSTEKGFFRSDKLAVTVRASFQVLWRRPRESFFESTNQCLARP